MAGVKMVDHQNWWSPKSMWGFSPPDDDVFHFSMQDDQHGLIWPTSSKFMLRKAAQDSWNP